MSLKMLITSMKIQYAKTLLQGGKSVIEACYDSDFSDCSYFISTFQKLQEWLQGSIKKNNSRLIIIFYDIVLFCTKSIPEKPSGSLLTVFNWKVPFLNFYTASFLSKRLLANVVLPICTIFPVGPASTQDTHRENIEKIHDYKKPNQIFTIPYGLIKGSKEGCLWNTGVYYYCFFDIYQNMLVKNSQIRSYIF